MKYYIGIDGGATNIKAGIVDSKGKMLKFLSTPTQSHLGKKIVAKNVVDIINILLSNKYKIFGIGLAWPKKINIPLTAKELKKILSKKYPLSIYENNDAALFAFGEAMSGQGKNTNTVLGITLGTGVGSGLIKMGNISNPEFGHTILNTKGPKCKCGNKGCFEEYAGSRSIKRLIKKYKLKALNGKELYKLATNKNNDALLAWEEYGKQLAQGLILATKTYNPDIIILGGDISKSFKFFSKVMNKEIKNILKNKAINIKKSKQKNSGIIGAALFAKQNIK